MVPSVAPSTEPVTLNEIKELARTKLKSHIWNFYVTGADDETTVKRNEEVYKELLLLPRVLVDVSAVNTSMTIFNSRYSISVAVAPSAYQKLVGDEGEVAVARAA